MNTLIVIGLWLVTLVAAFIAGAVFEHKNSAKIDQAAKGVQQAAEEVKKL